jgi:hypothetical protein
MNELPRFSAEASLYKTSRRYVGFAGATGSGQRLLPQLPPDRFPPPLMFPPPDNATFCQWSGNGIICGEPPFGGGVSWGGGPDKACVQCRSRCYQKHGAARQTCLANCEDLFC